MKRFKADVERERRAYSEPLRLNISFTSAPGRAHLLQAMADETGELQGQG